MPEAAEVARQGEFLKNWEGKTVKSISWDDTSKFSRHPISGWDSLVFPLEIKKVFTRGKIIVFCFEIPSRGGHDGSQGSIYLTSHLGMTGYYTTTTGKHSNLWFNFSDNTKLFFNDQRHFGNFTVSEDLKEIWEKNGPCLLTSALVRYGKISPEKLNRHQKLINREKWHQAFKVTGRQKNTKLCDFLIAQKRFSGVGNYLRCEIMYQARLHPEKTVISLTKQQIDQLYEATMETVYLSYKYNGPVNGYHHDGCMVLAVYGKEKDPNGYPVKTIQSQGRTVHYCPKIQKL